MVVVLNVDIVVVWVEEVVDEGKRVDGGSLLLCCAGWGPIPAATRGIGGSDSAMMLS